jgi:hypothetical protein
MWDYKDSKKLGQKMKFSERLHNIFRNKNTGIEVTWNTKLIAFIIVAKFSKSGLSAELEKMKAYNKAGQNIKPEDINTLYLETIILSVNLGN